MTTSDQALAEAIADHLGIFDEVHGSDGTLNLKGEKNGKFLEERFGKNGFAYMGDASAGLPVWQRAAPLPCVQPSFFIRRHKCILWMADDQSNSWRI